MVNAPLKNACFALRQINVKTFFFHPKAPLPHVGIDGTQFICFLTRKN